MLFCYRIPQPDLSGSRCKIGRERKAEIAAQINKILILISQYDIVQILSPVGQSFYRTVVMKLFQ